MKYPDNITRAELLKSDTAAKKGIDNTPTSQEHERHLCNTAWWLQELRTKLRKIKNRKLVIIISSGYRTPELNTAVKGSRTSDHMEGLAADFKVPGMTVAQVVEFIIENMDGYDQVINEYDRWVHVGLPRKQALKAVKVNGKTQYLFI
ncbi:D-Ala-D-Ala carboxypeptidase family metallohydrolase [Vibrio owensii]|uniref:D-Ala-D-Ala carboxypeptidase family metallohydrolase n=1 Tax=Vibrio owensii TaxID=696485 RepID=UPI00339B2743